MLVRKYLISFLCGVVSTTFSLTPSAYAENFVPVNTEVPHIYIVGTLVRDSDYYNRDLLGGPLATLRISLVLSSKGEALLFENCVGAAYSSEGEYNCRTVGSPEGYTTDEIAQAYSHSQGELFKQRFIDVLVGVASFTAAVVAYNKLEHLNISYHYRTFDYVQRMGTILFSSAAALTGGTILVQHHLLGGKKYENFVELIEDMQRYRVGESPFHGYFDGPLSDPIYLLLENKNHAEILSAFSYVLLKIPGSISGL